MLFTINYSLLTKKLSHFRFSFDKLFQEKVLAIEHGIREVGNPIPQDKHTRSAAQHQVEHDMPVTEHEIINGRMRF